MKGKSILIALALFITTAQQKEDPKSYEKEEYDPVTSYKDNGDSWSLDIETYPACGLGLSNSPIDLDTQMEGVPEDYFSKHYENLKGDVNETWEYGDDKHVYGKVYWSGKSSALYALLEDKGLGAENAPTPGVPQAPNYHDFPNWFNSSAGLFMEADEAYYAKQLHFHIHSEHTFDGELMDIELHVVHQSANATSHTIDTLDQEIQDKKWPLGKLGVVGILFDTTRYHNVSDQVVDAIDKFFDSLMLHELVKTDDTSKAGYVDPIPEEIAIGDLMNAMDMENRYVYNGSLTTPPCLEYVYWNVLNTVYPIKDVHLQYYKWIKAERAKTHAYAVSNGNFRTARPPAPQHSLRLLKGNSPVFEDKESGGLFNGFYIVIAIAIVIVLLIFGTCVWYSLRRAEQKKKMQEMQKVGADTDLSMTTNYKAEGGSIELERNDV